MKTSETIEELAKALVKAQSQMGGAVADSDNPFFKSKYADLGSVVKAIKEPFCENGLSYVQFPCNDDSGVGVTTRLMHTSGQWLEQNYTLPIVKRDPQAAGSAITYARRYALQSIAGIPTADDDAEAAMQRNIVQEKPVKPSKPKPSPAKTSPAKKEPDNETKIENEEQAFETAEAMLAIAKSMHSDSEESLADFYRKNMKSITAINKFPKAEAMLVKGFTDINKLLTRGKADEQKISQK
tara:strand:+ start:13509 stop:14228 length:720 start_codon:yes stop_codon:yes gene_type:complete